MNLIAVLGIPIIQAVDALCHSPKQGVSSEAKVVVLVDNPTDPFTHVHFFPLAVIALSQTNVSLLNNTLKGTVQFIKARIQFPKTGVTFPEQSLHLCKSGITGREIRLALKEFGFALGACWGWAGSGCEAWGW